MPPATNMTDAEKYAHAKELNRLRQKKYYDANKAKLLEAKKELRAKLRDENKDTDNVVQIASNQIVLEKMRTLEGNESSNKKYFKDLKTVLQITDCEQLALCLKEPKKIIDLIDTAIQKNGNDYSINSKKGFIQAVLKAITVLKLKLPVPTLKLYKNYFDKLKVLSGTQSKEKKDKEIDSFDYYLEKIKTKYEEVSKEYVLSKLYFEATLRDDFGTLEIIKNMSEVKSNTKQNYIIIPQRAGKAKLIIQAYKTEVKYGVIDVVLSAELTKLIKAYIKKLGIPYNGYLFGKNTNGLTDFVSKMNKSLDVKTDGAINGFRHMKSSLIEGNVQDINERLKLAEAMKHSPFIQEMYLRKLIQR